MGRPCLCVERVFDMYGENWSGNLSVWLIFNIFNKNFHLTKANFSTMI